MNEQISLDLPLPEPMFGSFIDLTIFGQIVEQLRAAGYGDDIDWSEGVQPPSSADEFATEAIFVICNSGMHHRVARQIYDRVMEAVRAGRSAAEGFRHIGKRNAIDSIWHHRVRLFDEYLAADDKVEYCGQLPWIGGITKYHLAKNFGANVAKPDVHLQRLAGAHGCSPQALCERLAAETGYRIATVDVVLWRACAIGLIASGSLGGSP